MHISLLKATAFFYFVGALFYLSFIVTQKERGARLGRMFLLVGVVLHAAGFASRISAAFLPGEVAGLAPALNSYWLPIHVLLLFVGDAVFAVAFGAGIMYLLQEKKVKRQKMGAISRPLPH